ncbi:hypothetical protein MMC14_008213 [Varicellaria rhodocarpa]|nr:hypothetical protein [Varicellaria rhodocarpa]
MFAWLWGDRITALEFLYDITKAFAFDGMVQSLDLHELRSMPVDHCVRFPVSSMIVPICGQLAESLGSKLSYPGNSSYVATQDSYWSLQEANLSPACILVPESPQDVSEAVSIISGIENCRFAIKGRSHAPAAGFANINAGVTIDMTKLSSITVSDDRTVASVGAGATWLDVYSYLDTLSLSVAGGRNGAVGVGGLTLGGGISYFLPRVGWACDNVVNFEIILASGKIANANATSRPDLFRALKGCTNNFGIVTRFDLTPFPQRQILGGNVAQRIAHRDAVFKAFTDIAGASEYDPYASIVTGIGFNSTSKAWTISSSAIYTKPVLNPPVYKELLAIPSVANTLAITNLSTLAAEPAIPKFNWLFYTGTYGVSAPLLSQFFDIINTTIYNFDPPGGIFWNIAFEPLPAIATQYGDQKGGNSLGTSPKDGNAIIMLLSALYPTSTSSTTITHTAQTLLRTLNQTAQEMGLLHTFQYTNYADPSQDPIGSYGQTNVDFLRKVSGRYDPRGIFGGGRAGRVPGGFKIPG